MPTKQKERRKPAAKPKAPRTPSPPAISEENGEVEDAFREFLSTVPTEANITTGLIRLPSYITPLVRGKEDLPPPEFAQDLDDMKGEVRARYGPGKYKLYIRFRDPKTAKRGLVAPTFVLAPTPEEEAALAQAEQPEDPGRDGIKAALDRLRGAIETKAQAAELSALERAATGTPPAVPPDPVAGMKSLAEVVRMFSPAQDPLAMLKTAKDLFTPSGSPSDQVALVREIVGFMRDMGDGRRGGVWETLITEIFGLLRESGPALLTFLQAYSAAQGRPSPAPGQSTEIPVRAATTPPAPQAPAESINDATVLQVVGNDQRKALALVTALNLALLEATTNYESPEDRKAGAQVVLDHMDTHCPGLTEQLRSLSPDQLWGWFSALDGRMAAAPNGRNWSDLLWSVLKPSDTTPGKDDLREE